MRRHSLFANHTVQLKNYSALPDEGLSEYLVQYTHAGHSKGCDSFACEVPVFSPCLAVVVPFPSTSFAEVCFEDGEEDEDEEVLSLLQFESWQRLLLCDGLITIGLTFSLPEVCARSLLPRSFLQPKSGLRILSMKKFVVLWACCAAWWGKIGGDGILGESETLSDSVESRLFWSFCSSMTAGSWSAHQNPTCCKEQYPYNNTQECSL